MNEKYYSYLLTTGNIILRVWLDLRKNNENVCFLIFCHIDVKGTAYAIKETFDTFDFIFFSLPLRLIFK